MKKPRPKIKAIIYAEDKLKFITQKLENLLYLNLEKKSISGDSSDKLVPFVTKWLQRWHSMNWVDFYW